MTEEEYRVKRLLCQLDIRVEAFVEKVKEIWTEAQVAEVHGGESPHGVLALIQAAEPEIFDHIEQLDGVLVLLCWENSYLLRTKGDWLSRATNLSKHGVQLADVRYELLQCRDCGAVYRAKRGHFYKLKRRYWECPNGCNR